jgi:glycosyltransferase involved in cell wall biosynthesis
MAVGSSTPENEIEYPGRAGVQQRLLPGYRVTFFDMLSAACSRGLSVFAGEPGPGEAIAITRNLNLASYYPARNRHFGRVDSAYYFLWQQGLIDWLEHWQPDVIILEANPRYITSRQAIRWMHARRRPVIGWGLGAPQYTSSGLFTYFLRKLRSNFLLSLDALIAYSQRGADEYEAQGFPADKIFVAQNAVSTRPAKPYPERTTGPGKRRTVLFVGRLQVRKRIDNLLVACANLPQAICPALWIVGEGPARAEFEELAQRIYPETRFFGAVHGSELARLFREADLFVLPGTGGLAVQEAMSYGLPVVVAEGDGTQNDLVSSENGWLVPPDDQDGLQKALQEALSNPDRLRSMGRESHRIVSQEINVEKMVEVFVQALNNTTVT